MSYNVRYVKERNVLCCLLISRNLKFLMIYMDMQLVTWCCRKLHNVCWLP
mgnify:CR=1 FL=1